MQTKADLYNELLQQINALVAGESDVIANMANISSQLYWSLADVNWAGFYLLKEGQLVLGPFHGKPACIRIPIGTGVCGTAVSENKIQMVEDVHAFSGHIACDAASNSEIVLPVKRQGQIIAVLDIDSPSTGRFDEEDKQGLAAIVESFEGTMI